MYYTIRYKGLISNRCILLIVRYRILAGKKNMNNEIDGLKEVCETMQIVQNGEKEIAVIEKEIADKMRAITAKIFDGTTKYRMPKQNILNEERDSSIRVWAFGVMLKDKIEWRNDGDFYGYARTLRVTEKGTIMAMVQGLFNFRQYNLYKGDWSGHPNADSRAATDHEIANHAGELAEELLEALNTRIDIMKGEKATLEKMAQAIL